MWKWEQCAWRCRIHDSGCPLSSAYPPRAPTWKIPKFFLFEINHKICMRDCDNSFVVEGNTILSSHIFPKISGVCDFFLHLFIYFHRNLNVKLHLKVTLWSYDRSVSSALANPQRFRLWIMAYRGMMSTNYIVCCVFSSPGLSDNRRINEGGGGGGGVRRLLIWGSNWLRVGSLSPGTA